jgi:hypothetical protein
MASKGINPSCNAVWGDEYINTWTNATVKSISCDRSKSSSVRCIDNFKGDRQCVFDNVQINFGLEKTMPRIGLDTFTKKFEKGFVAVDCDSNPKSEYIKFHYLYSTQVNT